GMRNFFNLPQAGLGAKGNRGRPRIGFSPGRITAKPYLRLRTTDSPGDRHDMRLDLAIHCTASETRRNGSCGDIGRFAQAPRIPCLNLVQQRRALAVRDGRNPWRRRSTACSDRVNLGPQGESALCEVLLDYLSIVVAVRRS